MCKWKVTFICSFAQSHIYKLCECFLNANKLNKYMIRLKYMLVPAFVLFSANAVQAEAAQIDNVAIGQRHTPRKKLGQSTIQRLKDEVEKTIATRAEQTPNADKSQVDSVLYMVDDNATKTIYTYDDEGEVVKVDEYRKTPLSNGFMPSSSVFYGPGGEDEPSYKIVTQYDVETPYKKRYEYDWTDYAPISYDVNLSPWDHITIVQEEVNGEWKTIRTCTPEIKNDLLLSLTYAELNDNDVLENTGRVVYQYDSEGKLIKIISNVYDKDETVVYNIKYTADGQLLWYGYEDGQWYAQYEYVDNNTIAYSEHDCSSGKDLIDFSSKQEKVTNTPYDFGADQEWVRYTESNYDDEGHVLSSEVKMVSFYKGEYYIVMYVLDNSNKAHNAMGATLSYNDDDTNVVYYTYDDEANLTDWSSYSQVTDYVDDYTKRETYYDIYDVVYSDKYTYYHNPNIAAISAVTNNKVNAAHKVYDLSGRITRQKSGIVIVDGKKKFLRWL